MTLSTRQRKFSKMIQKDLSEIFQQQYLGTFQGTLVTVTEVSMSPDLGFAKVFLSIFPVNKADSVMESLNQSKRAIRGELGRKIGKVVRVVPEIAFVEDSTAENAEKMDKLIDNLTIPEAPDEPED